ncbi:MAG: TetR/AcrR family transcriptional regulator [Deltaproteobacteria bacterium]|nr:TetR/AcrR family transcriptional regulator [Deltaproteobacteria bacterium]
MGAAAGSIDHARIDGRKARRAGTRAAVVDALLDLLEDGELRPTGPRIAARAGVSLRSIFQHFTDIEALFAAAADRQTERIRALASPVTGQGPLSQRLAAFAAQRARIFEAITPVRRAALLMEPFSPEIARRLRQARAAARREIERVFAPELSPLPASEQSEVLAALDAASGFSTWYTLRAHQDLAPEPALRVMTRLLANLLSEER